MPKGSTKQVMEPWSVAQPFLEGGMQDAADLYSAGGFQVNPYAGPMVAGYNNTMQQGDRMTVAAANRGNGILGGAIGSLNRAMNPATTSGATRQLVQNTIADIMPGINSSFAGSGMTGSDLHAQNLTEGVSAGVADVRNQMYQAGQNRAMQAAGMMPGMNAALLGNAGAVRNIGLGQQEHAQNVINANIIRDQQRQQAPSNALKDYMSLISGVASPYGSQTGRQNTGMMGILGMGLQALPLLMGLSDARAKTDIKRVGTTDDGEGVYTYKYKGGNTTHMGVMAQEIAQTKPHAVRDLGGLLAVDYGAL
ncbi:MAG: tail fiber domain-containing protein [Paracoccaceae bacterium]